MTEVVGNPELFAKGIGGADPTFNTLTHRILMCEKDDCHYASIG